MPKKLKVSNVGSDYCLTVRELAGFITGFGGTPTDENHTPVLLRCGGKNYRLAQFETVAGKPVLVGRRSQRD